MAVIAHHPDCDGYFTEHRSTVEPDPVYPLTMVRAVCEKCGPLHDGYYGKDARQVCARIALAHMRESHCDGRCADWK